MQQATRNAAKIRRRDVGVGGVWSPPDRLVWTLDVNYINDQGTRSRFV